MLVLLPPSEGKTRPTSGSPLDLSSIEPFADELRKARSTVLEELARVSGLPDALEILGVGKTLAAEVEENRHLANALTAPAWQVYSGVLYEAGEIDKRGERYAPSPAFEVLVQSALFGLVDLASPIPAYRLSMSTKLGGLGNLGTWWKQRLTDLLNARAHHQLVVDARSGAYQKAWPGLRGEFDLIRVNAVRERGGKRSVVSHNAKRYRGILAGALMDHAAAAKDSIDYVLDVARSIEVDDFKDVEVHEKPGYLELVIVTN